MGIPGEQDSHLPSVLLLGPLLHNYEEIFKSKFKLIKICDSSLSQEEFLTTHASSIRALLCTHLTPVDASTLPLLPDLRCIVTTSVGVDHIDVGECRRKGIAIANVGTVFSEDVADYAIGLLIDVLRGISTSDRYLRSGLWSSQGDYTLGSKLGTRKVGIVGFGSIGSKIAKRLEAFGCKISYFSRSKKSSVNFPYFTNVLDLAAENDVLIIACELNADTYHLINKDVLMALGKEGIIINVGRGAIIDQNEMVKLLVAQELGGAGLDVFENEPNVPKELFGMDNVILSPHIAVLTSESISDMFEQCMANLEAFFANNPLLTPLQEL